MSSIEFPKITKSVFVKLASIILFMVSSNSYAVEPFFQVHKADQSEVYGVSIGISDSFFNQREFNWAVSYNYMGNVSINNLEEYSPVWDESDNSFPLNTVDLMLNYRYYPKSYNSFIKTLIFEFQAGVGISLTENKFVFRPEIDTDDVYFSEQGDVNVALGFLVHKKISKQVSMQIGVKHYPDYSEFGDISSVYVGFSYRFGREAGY